MQMKWQEMWCGTDNTTNTLEPIDIAKEIDECELDIHYLPDNYEELDWHRLHQVPCLMGDDVLIAVDSKKQLAYAIFDEYCNAYNWEHNKSLELFARDNARDPEELDRYRVHEY